MEPMRGALVGMLRTSGRSAERGLAVVAVLALVHVESRDLVGEQLVSGAGGAMRGCRRARRVTLGACPGAGSAPRLATEAANRKPAGHHDRRSVVRAGRSWLLLAGARLLPRRPLGGFVGMVGLERGGRRRSDLRLRVAVLSAVVVGFVMNVSSAFATPVLTPVPGSPFASGVGTNAVAFSPSGRLLAAANYGPCCADSTLSVFSVGPGGRLTRGPGSSFDNGFHSAPGSVAFSPSGKLLVTTNTYYGELGLFSVGPGGRVTKVPGTPFATGGEFGQGPTSVAFSPSGALLATASPGYGTEVFSVGPGGRLTRVAGSPFAGSVDGEAVAFSPSGALLATASGFGGTVSVFSVGPGGALTQVPGSPFTTANALNVLGSSVASVAFSASGALLATAIDGGPTVSVFSVGPGGALTKLPGSPFRTGASPSVAFSPSGALLATANYGDNTVSVFSVGTGDALTQVAGSPFTAGNDSGPASLVFSPSGALLATANNNHGTVSVFSVNASKKQPPCVVPKLKGKSLAAARSALQEAHCAVGKITQHKSSTVPKGRVISSIPAAASRHNAGTKIALTVSHGKH